MPRPVGRLDDLAIESWIGEHVERVGPIEVTHERPWATVMRVPTANGVAWFKACAPVQAFEPRLTAALFARWPDRVPEVLGYDEERAWLLLADAGTPIRDVGSPPEAWLTMLSRYAELQRGEAEHARDHLAHGVPDLRVATLPERFEVMVRQDLPLDAAEVDRLKRYAPRFASLCSELVAHGIPETIQHDDLHMANVYDGGGHLRVLDWGDASISHPFGSLVETFRFLESFNGLPPSSPWFARLRDAYLEPWGGDRRETFAIAMLVGSVAHAIAWRRQRDHLPEQDQAEFDEGFSIVLRRALMRTE